MTSPSPSSSPISDFIRHHYRHFNAAELSDAAEAYKKHLERGGKMFLAMGGAMSTAELGLSLAEMIRQDKVHGISCTGANLEEDIFNLVAHDHYVRVSNYRDLTPLDEKALYDRKLNRVTDTCIPEEQAMRKIERIVLEEWRKSDGQSERKFPHEYLYQILEDRRLEKDYQIDPKHSWMIAAMEKKLPLFVPGWEDSTLGNMYASRCIQGVIKNIHTIKTGVEYMISLAQWYQGASQKGSMGFFQIGGGISGDFPICVVPMIHQDMGQKAPMWEYFCQVSDSTTSYGSYSGAVPNEKITWGKLGVDTPNFVIESDATIVVPLIFASVLGW